MDWSESASALAGRLLPLLPKPLGQINWQDALAAVWQKRWLRGHLVPYSKLNQMAYEDLLCIDEQKSELDLNTRQFVAGLPANHALLSGAKGTGKSSLVHALLHRYAGDGLRLIQIDKDHLLSLADVLEEIRETPYKFILFCDDLSFETEDATYKTFKSALEGSVFSSAANVLVYATSNRRHLLPEYTADNAAVSIQDGELQYGEALDEKISLSDRFGLWLSFHAFNQADYLSVAGYWIETLAAEQDCKMLLDEEARLKALQWALKRGTRSGRSAQHFARHWVGYHLLKLSK